ncbi:MAG: hypothetical protein Fur009_5970 [Candidatus Microgenomates bacterium]
MYLSIFKTLKYFSIFSYPPTFEEIYTFLPVKISKKKLKQELERLIKQKIIKDLKIEVENCYRYTIGEYGINKSKIKNQKSKIEKNNNLTIQQFNNFYQKHRESQKKLRNWRFRLYIKLLSFFPQIKLIGLSGSLAMMNAKKEDDIDLFIITSKNRLFTGRFIAVILAQLLNLRRHFVYKTRRTNFYAPVGPLFPLLAEKTSQVAKNLASSSFFSNKVCLNLFFDESDLQAPKFKQSEYVAHEVLQMKPIINKSQTYENFLAANRWVMSFFPNCAKIFNFKFLISNKLLNLKNKNYKLNKNLKLKIENFGNWLENMFKKFQLKLINKHKTTEIITDFQLWFHPDDFEKRIKV